MANGSDVQPEPDGPLQQRRPKSTDKRYLLPICDSPASVKACLWAVEKLYEQGDQLILLHVLYTDTSAGPEDKRRREEETLKLLGGRFHPLLAPLSVSFKLEVLAVDVSAVICPPTIGDVICQYAAAKAVTAIVLTSDLSAGEHEHGHVSIARQCTKTAGQPVYVVHSSGQHAKDFASNSGSSSVNGFLKRVSPSLLFRRSPNVRQAPGAASLKRRSTGKSLPW